MVDLLWKDVALGLLVASWGGVCWWCGRIQITTDTLRAELSVLRETLPLHYVLKTENSEVMKRIEDKIDRLVERMIP